jgi:ATP-dependent protease Clp ATPase subunit
MKTNPNDLTVPIVSDGPKFHGLTKLEHFAAMIFQTKLTPREKDENRVVPAGQIKLLARQSVREASILMEALNEHYQMLEASTIVSATQTHAIDLPTVADILRAGKAFIVANEIAKEELGSTIAEFYEEVSNMSTDKNNDVEDVDKDGDTMDGPGIGSGSIDT